MHKITTLLFIFALITIPVAPQDTAAGDSSDDTYTDAGEDLKGSTVYASQKETQVMSEMTAEDIKKLNPADIKELLTKGFNVSVKNYGGYGSVGSINIRGLGGGRILVLIDGVPVNSGQSGDADLSKINIADIESIQLIKGGSDTKFNFSGAVGGVINIITSKRSEAGYKVWADISNKFYYPDFYFPKNSDTSDNDERKFSAWYDFFDTQSWNGGLGVGNEKIYLNLGGGGNRAINHYIYIDSNDKKRERTDNEIYDGSANGSIDFKLPMFMSLNAGGKYYYGNKNMPGTINNNNVGKQIDHDASGRISFDADMVGSDRIDTELTTSYRYNLLDWDDDYGHDTHKLHNVTIINKWGFITSDWLTVNIGGDFTYDYSDSTSTGYHSLFNGGGYITLNFNIKNAVKIIPSVKAVYYEDYPVFVPKLGFSADIKDFTLKANFFRTYTMPSVDDLYWPADSFAKGNPDLKPEDGLGGDLGLSYYKQGYIRGETVLFVNYIKDMIIWQPAGQGLWQPENVDRALTFGAEINLSTDFSKYVNFTANYTFTMSYCLNDDYDFNDDKRLAYTPMHILGLGVNFNWITGSLSLSGHYESERYTSTTNTAKLGQYFTLDVDISQRIKFFTIYLAVKNALNSFYYTVLDYPSQNGSITLGLRFDYNGKFPKKSDGENTEKKNPNIKL